MNGTFEDFLTSVGSDRRLGGRIVHVEEISARKAVWADRKVLLTDAARKALEAVGVERLYSHQGEAIEAARRGEHAVIVTGTASGKTLCYNIPVLEGIREEGGTALYLFPTKALAQDQLRGLTRLLDAEPRFGSEVCTGTYDGDTTRYGRRKLREKGNIILSNPDMLHAGILPNHPSWNRFFGGLRFVVLDEIHAYRGIFGSNVGCVIRRLRRIANHYGADPVFLCCSATIANPAELAGRLLGDGVRVIGRVGSPRGPRRFVLWNPPFIDDAAGVERRSSNVEGKDLMVRLVREGVPTILFSRARVTAELVYRYAREDLKKRDRKLADRIAVYRGGYLPEERREIEKRLFSGELLAVSSTNALELGIDVGSLGASILVGFPGTIAGTWQQSGRAGRTEEESLSVLVAHNDPIDQYLIRHPEYFFGRSPENAIVDPENPYILERHLRCAAHELPIAEEESDRFGDLTLPIVEVLEEYGEVTRVKDRFYWALTDYPAAGMSLRNMSDATYTIIDQEGEGGPRTIGNVDAVSAPELLYPEAIYLHEGETWFVRELDQEQKVAYVERREVDYYTQAIVDSTIRLGEIRERGELGPAESILAEATVTWMTTGFKKIKFYGQDSIGWGKLDLPPQHLETVTFGIRPGDEALETLGRFGLRMAEALAGVRSLLLVVLPLHAMCDPSNLGGVVESSNLGRPAVFIYDRFPKGLGLSEKGFDTAADVLSAALELVRGCPCADGCPSCVGQPRPPLLHHDPDLMRGYPIPNKEGAVRLLEMMTR